MRKRAIGYLPRAVSRRAFTLIELLVVIAIIAALMALSASAVIKFMGTQQESNTKSTLERTQSQLNKAYSKVKDDAYKETIPAATDAWIRANLAGSDANATGRVRVIYVKLRQRQAFPMSFAEALDTRIPGIPPLPVYATYLTKNGVQPNTTYGPFESSACLLMALQRGMGGKGVDTSDLTAGGATGNASLPNGNIPYLTDAWGSPIFFSRVPVGSSTLNPGGAQAGANDPGDPQGYLQTPAWGTTFGPAFTALTLQQLAPGNTSFKIAPLLASAGPNKVLQVNPITFAAAAGTDDLISSP